jgi:hypothetical protein
VLVLEALASCLMGLLSSRSTACYATLERWVFKGYYLLRPVALAALSSGDANLLRQARGGSCRQVFAASATQRLAAVHLMQAKESSAEQLAKLELGSLEAGQLKQSRCLHQHQQWG